MFEILLISAGTLLCILLCYGVATALLVRIVVPLLSSVRNGLGYWKSLAVMMIVTLIMAGMHLIAIVFPRGGELATFEAALYFSAENYTALGYGDLLLSGRWRILGPLEAVNGLLLIGLSTATMFAVLNRLIAIRLRRQESHRSQGRQLLSEHLAGSATHQPGLAPRGGVSILAS